MVKTVCLIFRFLYLANMSATKNQIDRLYVVILPDKDSNGKHLSDVASSLLDVISPHETFASSWAATTNLYQHITVEKRTHSYQ